MGVDDDDLLDLLMQQPVAFGTLEAEFHVLGGEPVAVVEANALAQPEFILALVLADGPGLGETRRHEVARHRLHQRVVDRIEEPERRELPRSLARVEPCGAKASRRAPSASRLPRRASPHYPVRRFGTFCLAIVADCRRGRSSWAPLGVGA